MLSILSTILRQAHPKRPPSTHQQGFRIAASADISCHMATKMQKHAQLMTQKCIYVMIMLRLCTLFTFCLFCVFCLVSVRFSSLGSAFSSPLGGPTPSPRRQQRRRPQRWTQDVNGSTEKQIRNKQFKRTKHNKTVFCAITLVAFSC